MRGYIQVCLCIYMHMCVSLFKGVYRNTRNLQKAGKYLFFIIQQLAVMGLIPQEVTRGAVRESSKKGNVEAC